MSQLSAGDETASSAALEDIDAAAEQDSDDCWPGGGGGRRGFGLGYGIHPTGWRNSLLGGAVPATTMFPGYADERVAPSGRGAAKENSEVGVSDRSTLRTTTKGQCTGKWNGMLIDAIITNIVIICISRRRRAGDVLPCVL